MSENKIREHHILQRFEVGKKMGSGAYGIVWKVVDKFTGQISALKKNFDAFQNSTDAQRTYRQIMFLQQLRHPNIVEMRQVIGSENEKDIYILFELMDIDLHGLIKENMLKDQHKRYIIYQLATAFHYIHTADLIHRDIKPSNILLNQECQAKICDFGLVRFLHQNTDTQPQLTDYIATRWYRAPQILLGSKKYSKAADVWSFGCLIGELLTGKPMFPGHSTLNQIERVLTWTGPPSMDDLRSLKTDFGRQMLEILNKIKPISHKQWINCSSQGYDLLRKILSFNPQERPTMQQIAKHPYLREFYNKKQIVECSVKIKMGLNDNTKLNLDDYRKLIYKIVDKYELAQNYSSQLSNLPNDPTKKTLYKARTNKPVVIRSEPKSQQSSLPKSTYKDSNTVNIKKYSSYLTRKDNLFKTSYVKTDQTEGSLKKKMSYTVEKKKKPVHEGRRMTELLVRHTYQHKY